MGILKRLNLISLLLAVIVTLGGYVVWRSHFTKFRAQARLAVMQHIPRILFRTAESENADEYKRYQRTQQALVTSQLVLNTALLDESIRKFRMLREQFDPIAWIQDALEVEFIGESEVMEIALRGDYPDEVAGLVNAVTKAYVDEVVDVDTKRRADRHEKLKKLKQTYQELLKERREALRKLSEIGASDDRLRIAGLERRDLLRLHHDLWMQRIDLQRERAEAETRLAERNKAVADATDPVRKEIDRIEDQLAGLIAQEKVFDERLAQISGEIRKSGSHELDLEPLKAEIAAMEDVARKLADEIEALNIERQAPPRVRLIETAIPPRTREGVTILGW